MEFFSNDTEALTVGGLTFENGLGSLVISGALTLSPDASSAALVKSLQAHLAKLEIAISKGVEAFPKKEEERSPAPLDVVDNPFGS